MKKRLILLTALALTMLLTACGGSQGGEDSAHPYSWKETLNGSVQLTIKNAPEDGYSWLAEESASGLVIKRTDNGSGSKAVFSLTGEDFNDGVAIFTCRRDSAPYDISYQLNLTLSASRKGGVEVVAAEYSQFPAAGSAGDEENAVCVWYVAEDGTRKIYLGGADGTYTWKAMGYDSSLLSLDGPDYDETGITYRLTGLAAGETDLLLYDLDQDRGFRLTVSVAEDLSVDVTGCEEGTYTISADQIPGMEDAKALVGELAFSEEVRVLRCETGSWYGGDEADYVQLRLQTDGGMWSLLMTPKYTVPELIEMCYGTSGDVVRTDVSVGDIPAVLCGTGTEQALFWTDSQGCGRIFYALSDEEPAQAELLHAARSLSKEEA